MFTISSLKIDNVAIVKTRIGKSQRIEHVASTAKYLFLEWIPGEAVYNANSGKSSSMPAVFIIASQTFCQKAILKSEIPYASL